MAENKTHHVMEFDQHWSAFTGTYDECCEVQREIEAGTYFEDDDEHIAEQLNWITVSNTEYNLYNDIEED